MNSEKHVLEVLAAYALDALEPAEMRQVEEHLQTCAACRTELNAFQNVSGQLSLAIVEIDPPVGLKERLLAKAKPEKSLPVRHVSKGSPLGRRQPAFWRHLPAWGVGGLLLVLLLFTSNLLLLQRLNRLETTGALPLPFVELSSTEHAPEARAVLVMSKDSRKGTLVVDGLVPLGDERQYQLWLIAADERTSGGVFSVGAEGYGYLRVTSPGPLLEFDSFGVTIEPHGGSPAPTGQQVLAAVVN
jgi:anti-sigma-K factor RskA